MRVGDLISGFDVAPAGPDARAGRDVRVCDLTEDSRTVMPGSLFIARKGQKADGRRFVAAAIEAGAVAVLTDDPELSLPPPARGAQPVALLRTGDIQLAAARLAERFYGSPSERLTLIGVTGTKGKTTTSFLIHQVLNALGVRCGMMGTVVIDDGVEVAPATLTTPPALEVSRTLARMLEAGCRAAVMEVSSHALHQRRVGALSFRCGVFTNLTGDHLDYHGTMDEYAAAKAMLLEALPDDGAAIVNVQDDWHTRVTRGCRAPIWRCSVEDPLSIRAERVDERHCRVRVRASSTAWTDLELLGPWGRAEARLPLVGRFNAMNALQALAAVYAVAGARLGIAPIAEALSRVVAPPGRMEAVTRPDSPLSVLVDYAHTDDALRQVLGTVRGAMGRASEGRGGGALWCVFGCGGDRDATKRPRMGRVAAELADRVVITSDNPRTESPRAIIEGILEGVPRELLQSGSAIVEPDRERAIARAIREAHPGDVVVIAGKGHETYQILPDPDRPGQTVTRRFDDREVARAALRLRGVEPLAPPEAPPPEEPGDEADVSEMLPAPGEQPA